MTKRMEGPSAAVRIRVMKRDRFACTYCGVPGTDAELEIDHIVAVAKGGSHHISNLTTACRACNQAKSDKPAESMKGRQTVRPDGGLIGLFFHTFSGDENENQLLMKVEYQGRIRSVDGDMVLVELFNWFHGYADVVKAFPKSLFYSARCRLYLSSEEMNDFYERYSRMRSCRCCGDVTAHDGTNLCFKCSRGECRICTAKSEAAQV